MRQHSMPALRALTFAFAVAAAALMACTGGGGPIKDAQEVVVGPVEFKIPGTMTSTGAYGVDSAVGEWKSADLSLFLDLGSHSDPLGYTAKDQYRYTHTTIDGKTATIERFMDPGADAQRPYVAAVHFEDAGGGQKLTVFGRAATEDDQDVLMAVFKTIDIDEPEA